MMYSELSVPNFRRICIINWSLSLPVLLLFAWPYYLAGSWLKLEDPLLYPGAIVFGLPFMMTVLHGHVTMALGALHRHHYYNWLSNYPLSYGFMFHPIMFRTRFRLLLAVFALLLLFALSLV